MRPVSASPVAALALLLAGCGGDGLDLPGDGGCVPPPCPAIACLVPFSLTVLDGATGQPIDGASATSAGLSCRGDGPIVSCDAGGAPGTYAVTVSAPGHVAAEVAVTVEPAPVTGPCECPRCQAWGPSSVSLAAAP